MTIVLLFGEHQGRHFHNKETDLVIFFIFVHRGLNNQRIILKADPAVNIQLPIPLKEIGTDTKFLVNADYPGYAMLYSLKFNPNDKTIKLELLEYPELGRDLISEEEKEGLTIYF